VPESLRQAGAQVRVHADHFPEDERDEVWLAEAGARGWTVITRDRGIRYRETELAALKTAGVAAFVLTAKGFTGPQNGAILAKALPAMLRYLVGNRPPFIAAVSASSRLSMLYRGRRRRTRHPRTSR
jgi:PIN domain-containing protein